LTTLLVSVAPFTSASFVCAIAAGAKSIANPKAHHVVFIAFLPSDTSVRYCRRRARPVVAAARLSFSTAACASEKRGRKATGAAKRGIMDSY
jgi:hypothetical protein